MPAYTNALVHIDTHRKEKLREKPYTKTRMLTSGVGRDLLLVSSNLACCRAATTTDERLVAADQQETFEPISSLTALLHLFTWSISRSNASQQTWNSSREITFENCHCGPIAVMKKIDFSILFSACPLYLQYFSCRSSTKNRDLFRRHCTCGGVEG